jgi:hypothetical protein
LSKEQSNAFGGFGDSLFADKVIIVLLFGITISLIMVAISYGRRFCQKTVD